MAKLHSHHGAKHVPHQRDIEGVLVVARCPADLDRRLHIEGQAARAGPRARAAAAQQELVQLGHILELGVAVEQQGGVVGEGVALRV